MDDAITDGLHVRMSLREQVAELDRQVRKIALDEQKQHNESIISSRFQQLTKIATESWTNAFMLGTWATQHALKMY